MLVHLAFLSVVSKLDQFKPPAEQESSLHFINKLEGQETLYLYLLKYTQFISRQDGGYTNNNNHVKLSHRQLALKLT